MSYVITGACAGVLDLSCIEVCPVDCIRPLDGADGSAGQLYINPRECVDCDACADVCPAGAIYPEDELPAGLRHFAELNRRYFQR